jgi:uncharacterized membrane protein
MNRLLKVSRLEGLTDGIFAVAMTILVLDLRLPAGAVDSTHLHFFLNGIYLKLFIYSGSFIILGTLWIAMNFQFGILDHLNRTYLWCNIFYLMAICIVPFSASLVAAFPNNETSITFFAMNLLCCSLGQLLISECARIYHLNGPRYTPAIRRAVLQRISVGPPFYIFSIVLASVNTTIAFIILIIPPLVYMIPGYVDQFDREQ